MYSVLDLEQHRADDQRMTSKYMTCRATLYYIIYQWEPSVLCSSCGALMSHTDRSACAVPLH